MFFYDLLKECSTYASILIATKCLPANNASDYTPLFILQEITALSDTHTASSASVEVGSDIIIIDIIDATELDLIINIIAITYYRNKIEVFIVTVPF